jgi:hypothetical protein
MKTKHLLFLTALLFLGASPNVLGQTTEEEGDGVVPPNLEEIHLDLAGGTTPTKPKSIFLPPVRVWYNATDRSLIVEPDPQTGWLTVCVEDEAGTLLLSQEVDGNAGQDTIDLKSLKDGYYKLSIKWGAPNPAVLTGWFAIH